MDRNEVEQIVFDILGDYIDGRYCPVCKKHREMIKAGRAWRCLSCLGLFKEVLVEYEPKEKPHEIPQEEGEE